MNNGTIRPLGPSARFGLYLVAGATSALSVTRVASASTNGVMAEGVSDYSFIAGNHNSDIDCAKIATDFYSRMTASGTIWARNSIYTNNAVYDTDFLDPDVNGGVGDDTDNFDKATTAVALACGHGRCTDATIATCNTRSDCPAGMACMANPPSKSRSCCTRNDADNPRQFLTSSTESVTNVINYSEGAVALGEDVESGQFRGAGSNGGDNVVFLINSCGMRPPFFFDETVNMFAGMALLNAIMPVSDVLKAGTADTASWSAQGASIATIALANANAAVANAWFANMDAAPQTAGGSCPDYTSDYTYGGGFGIGGCGAYISIAYDDSSSNAQWDTTSLTWAKAQVDVDESHGNSNGYARWHCNYACNTYGFNK